MTITQRLSFSLFIMLLALPFYSSAESMPTFQDYPASKAYAGKTAKVILKTAQEKSFAKHLRETTKQAVNFAGEYVLTTWGCGSSCTAGAVVSLKTGRVVFLPGICCWGGEGEREQQEFHINSRLLITAGEDNEKNVYGVHFYELTGREFKHLKTTPVARQPE